MRRAVHLITLAMLAAALAGCASIVDGTTQQITINTDPQGAKCTLAREGALIGSVTTPNAILVKKTKHNIDITCEKDGFKTATMNVKSDVQDATFGNILLGGVVGWAVDSASGADNKYADNVSLKLDSTQE